MAEALAIRRYEPADAERVWTVHERALRASPLEFVEEPSLDDDLRAVTEQYIEAGGEFLVGAIDTDRDGEIVAVGGFQPRCDDVVQIQRVRVLPEYQRRGFGEQLLLALETRARERGFDQVVVTTNEDLAAARTLYETHGYEETGRDRHPLTGDEFVDFEKAL